MRILALIVTLFFSSAVLAQAAPPVDALTAAAAAQAAASSAAPATPGAAVIDVSAPAVAGAVNVFKLDLGQQAPFNGVLLDEQTFLRYLKSQIALEEATWRIASKDKLLVAAEAQVERTWTEKYGLMIGLGLGFAGGVALLLTARSLVK